MKKMTCAMLSLVISASSILSLSSCSGKKTDDKDNKGKFSVGLVSDTAGINDEAFNSSAWLGMTNAKKNLGFDINYLESKQESEYESNLDKMTDSKPNAIFAVGYRMASAFQNVASKNPNQYYVMLDYRYEDTLPNTLAIEFRDQESSYLVGYIAGNMTKSNKVGIIIGGESEVIDRFKYGFKGGVANAAKELGKEIFVDVQCADNFQDDSKGKAMANAMYANDVDIVFSVAGNLGKGVIEAAKENNKYAIGVDQDQSYLAPDNVLTSAMKLVGGAVYDVCENIKDGKYVGGESRSVGLKENGVGIASTTVRLVPKDIILKMETIKQCIMDGEIIPPYNQTTFNDFIK